MTKRGPGTAHSARGNPYLFTGRQWGEETGLYYFRARYYDCQQRRFIAQDPWGPQAGLNLYEYVRGRVTIAIDPLGLDSIQEYNCHTDTFTWDLAKWLGEIGRKIPFEAQISIQRTECDCCNLTTGQSGKKYALGGSASVGASTLDQDFPFVFCGIPMVVKLSGQISGGGSISAEYNECSREETVQGSLQVCANIGGALGVGTTGVSAGVYGSINACVQGELQGPAAHPKLKIYGSGGGEIGVYVEILWYTYQHTILQGSVSSAPTYITLW